MEKKYEFTGEAHTLHDGTILRRIRAIKNFGNVKAGDLGGFIENEKNLSHEGLCWVSDEARVFDSASVSGSAWVFGSARVCGSASVSGNASVSGSAWVEKK